MDRSRWFAVASFLFVALPIGLVPLGPSTAAAQEPSASPPPDQLADGPSTTPIVAPLGADATHAHAHWVLETFSRQAQRERLVGNVAMFGIGVATLAMGLLADYHYDEGWGRPIWITGIVSMGVGILGLFQRSAMESLAGRFGSASPAELQAAWAAQASRARRTRAIGGVISIALGGCALVAGSVIAAGAGDLDDNDEEIWSTSLLLGGAGVAISGFRQLVVETPIEHGFETAYGAGARRAEVGVLLAPTRGGGALGVQGRF